MSLYRVNGFEIAFSNISQLNKNIIIENQRFIYSTYQKRVDSIL